VENDALTLKNLKVTKSTGLDKISAKVLKIGSSIIAPSLTFIFNLSLSSGIFIDDWKNAPVCPVYKGNDRRDMGNYRPTSILPALIQMCDDWYDNMDKGKLTSVVFLDIRKAFDSVDRSILLEKIQFYGVADSELM